MSDLQLERSVLEAKERDELFAIAQALGSKPSARTKKADLVTQILQVTGVEEAAPAVEKPRRRTVRSAAATTQAPTGGEPEQLELAAAGGASSNGNGRVAHAASDAMAVGPAPELASAAHGANGEQPVPTAKASVDEADARGGEPAQGFQRGDQGQGRSRPEPRQDRSDQGQRGGGDEPGLGNSRRRRRRSRDKAPRGPAAPEREFTAQVPETSYSGELVTCSGLLDLRDEGYGFMRTSGYLASASDVYVSITQVRRYGLRKGDLVEGAYRPAANNEKYPALVRVDSVGGLSPDDARNRPKFENLTPLFPDEKLSLEVPGDAANVTARIVDLVSPIGKGQRGLIVSPPKAGKTTILKQIAHSIEANNPEVHLMILLVDERPEEVTDWRRSVKGEVIASTFDRPSDEHTQVAELAIERAKRLLEVGRHVVIVLDGITRLARAYNLAQPATGRIMSGGIDTGALYPPKKFFGSARNIEEGGSLTILATALVETGSRMDEVIFEEFKGTGNMELRLDRKLAERRIYPALDVNASSTRHEELLFDRQQLQQVWKLRRVLNALATDGNAAAGLELLVDKIRTTRSNDQFLAEIAKTPAPAI
ncbi:MAG TPA: transcription termination factor Rho [Acidimicrobiales bacterium]|nr:transcription termination factor Rho [Acidimicrobiales bacterium]